MNDKDKQTYFKKVDLLLHIVPFIEEEQVFAIHGGTAINLFHLNLPRLSVDIDMTYIPLNDRKSSLEDINIHLQNIRNKVTKAYPDIKIVSKTESTKLLCERRGSQIKVEVNQTKRGIIGGKSSIIPLCAKAQQLFKIYCDIPVVPLTQLYGGKIAAALSRQHPRDLFDVKHMDIPVSECREGIIYGLLGSDKPVYESLSPQLIDQTEALENQFRGMSDEPFTYEDFEDTRLRLVKEVNAMLTEEDKDFLVSFEKGMPKWDAYEFGYFKDYPSVQWKILNIRKLASSNPDKLDEEVHRLETFFDKKAIHLCPEAKELIDKTIAYAHAYIDRKGLESGWPWTHDAFVDACTAVLSDNPDRSMPDVCRYVKNHVISHLGKTMEPDKLRSLSDNLDDTIQKGLIQQRKP